MSGNEEVARPTTTTTTDKLNSSPSPQAASEAKQSYSFFEKTVSLLKMNEKKVNDVNEHNKRIELNKILM